MIYAGSNMLNYSLLPNEWKTEVLISRPADFSNAFESVLEFDKYIQCIIGFGGFYYLLFKTFSSLPTCNYIIIPFLSLLFSITFLCQCMSFFFFPSHSFFHLVPLRQCCNNLVEKLSGACVCVSSAWRRSLVKHSKLRQSLANPS